MIDLLAKLQLFQPEMAAIVFHLTVQLHFECVVQVTSQCPGVCSEFPCFHQMNQFCIQDQSNPDSEVKKKFAVPLCGKVVILTFDLSFKAVPASWSAGITSSLPKHDVRNHPKQPGTLTHL